MMKPLLILLLTLICVGGYSQEDNDIDILHYHFNIEVNDANDSIKCSAVIDYRFINSSDKIWLDLVSRKANGKGMKVWGVWDEETKQPLSFTHSDDKVRINLDGKKSGDKKVRIDYRGIPADGLIISKNKFNQRTFFADNWPNRGRNWLVCKDEPADKAAVDFIVTAPVHYQVISNGVQVEETNLTDKLKLTHWRETVDLPTKVMAIGIAEFAVNYQGDAESIPVYSWVFPGNRMEGFKDYAVATKVLSFFIKNIGPFPYKKLANVQSKTIFGGMENAGAIFYSENSVGSGGGLDKLIAHEIAHQWFGDMLTERDFSHVWLSEGFATFMALAYIENAFGEDSAKKEFAKNRRKVIGFSKNGSGSVVDSTEKNYINLLNPNSYEKGGWILYMLRKQLGDTIFWKGIRNYYSAYAGKNAITENFRTEMEKVCGKDLKQFFHQWLYVPGQPQIKVTKSYDNGTLTVMVMQKNEPLFEFPLTLRVVNKDGEVTKSIRVSQKETTFKIPMGSDAEKIILDPNVGLLFEEIN
ncbi:MAG: M1 family metallopeptidase [Flavitalea sp.]